MLFCVARDEPSLIRFVQTQSLAKGQPAPESGGSVDMSLKENKSGQKSHASASFLRNVVNVFRLATAWCCAQVGVWAGSIKKVVPSGSKGREAQRGPLKNSLRLVRLKGKAGVNPIARLSRAWPTPLKSISLRASRPSEMVKVRFRPDTQVAACECKCRSRNTVWQFESRNFPRQV